MWEQSVAWAATDWFKQPSFFCRSLGAKCYSGPCARAVAGPAKGWQAAAPPTGTKEKKPAWADLAEAVEEKAKKPAAEKTKDDQKADKSPMTCKEIVGGAGRVAGFPKNNVS